MSESVFETIANVLEDLADDVASVAEVSGVNTTHVATATDPAAIVANDHRVAASSEYCCQETHAAYGQCRYLVDHDGEHIGTPGNRMTAWQQ